MAKKNNDSLSNFDYLDDIEKEFSQEEEIKTESKKEINRVGEKKENKPVDKKKNDSYQEKQIEQSTVLKQGRPSGYFVQQFPDKIKQGGVKNITIYETIHEQLHDLVYHISKKHVKDGKDRVSMLGVSVKALMIGMEQLKKEYGIK
jgi:hypothetical protein